MSKQKKRILIALIAVVCAGLAAGVAFGRYAGEWNHDFGLQILPVQQNETDYSLRRYFRSNELLSASEGAEYAINGTQGWFTVANALDSSTVSQDAIKYTLTWSVSDDGTNWTTHKTETGTFAANAYGVAKYSVEPVTIGGKVYDRVKVTGRTSSFLQEDIEAVYSFTYTGCSVSTTYASGVITVSIDTNDTSGTFRFTWTDGITPDNSDPTLIFANAEAGPSQLTATLGKNTAYQFLFFVTDSTLLQQLEADPTAASFIVSVTR